jgi:signal transduction histidine kinase
MARASRVLLIDDDEDEFVITKDLFDELEGGLYELEWAPSYDEGVERVKRAEHAAYLVDYDLGARTGIELLREARGVGCGAAIVILTGAGDRSIDLQAMQAGADDYLDKRQLTATALERSLRYAIERRRAAEKLAHTDAELRRLDTLFANAPAMINILVGPQHVYELVHPRLRAILGRDVTGLPVRQAVPEAEEQGFVELLDRVYYGGEVVTRKEMPWRTRTPDGVPREMFFDLTFQPWREPHGQIAGVMAFAVEVTEQVQARQRVEDAVRVRDDFLSIASHELKTPLTPLTLQIDELCRVLQKRSSVDPSLLPLLDSAKRQTRRLAALVEDLLDVTRISSQRLVLRLEDVDLCALVRDTMDRFRPQAEAAHCPLHVEACAVVVGQWDKLRIERVISNLLSNAIKYGGGKPIVARVDQVGETARLTIRDEGIGIPAEHVGRIFGRFERAVSSRHYGGLGLGLYIARELVEVHGGRILVTSNPGAGSTFTVMLPLRRSSGRDAPPSEHASISS